MSQSELTRWNKIVEEQTESTAYTDVFGKKQTVPPGKTKDSFEDCLKLYLQSRFNFNAAENQKMYVQVGLRKSGRVTVRQFMDRIKQLNDIIDWLPMKYYSPRATELTEVTEKFSDAELVMCVMRALPEPWQNDLLKTVQGDAPESTREMLQLLELIEKSPPSMAPAKDNSKAKPAGGENSSSKKRHGGDQLGRVPKKPKKGSKHCALCAKHGGKERTHNTDTCRKYNPDGTPKWTAKPSEKSDKKANKAFAQMKHTYDKNNKLLKKLLKKQAKKDKKRQHKPRYDSSDYDSDSS